MKLITLSITGILLSASLTSCWPRTEKAQENIATPVERTLHANNIIYLHTMVTRGQDETTIFNDLIKTGNVVVDFYADWCGPCKTMGRTIDQIAGQFPAVTFLKVDTDRFKSIGTDVQGIPTLIFYKNGTQLTRFTGAKDKNTFTALLNKWYQESAKQ